MSRAGRRFALGIDFGTLSTRAMLVDVVDGAAIAAAEHAYRHGVIDRCLPEGGPPLPPTWALQHPLDWLESMQFAVTSALRSAGIEASQVVGIGIDFTSCTVLPCLADGSPVCLQPVMRHRPHAWPKLWKHHAAEPQAERINRTATERGEPWLARYGGRLSCEWLIPKALELIEGAPEIAEVTDRLVEAGDWVVAQLSGAWLRNACAAGYKACGGPQLPSREFLGEVHPGLGKVLELWLRAPVCPPGQSAAGLTVEWAQRLGLDPGTVVAVATIDAHAGVLGVGIREPGILFMMLGTSTCHMLNSTEYREVPGVQGVVQGGILPGLYGYEAGQAAVGDIFSWFANRFVQAADEIGADSRAVHDSLSRQAAALPPGGSGLVALDWLNGCRTPLVDAQLSGALVGLTLHTTPAAIYRALIESTAYGAATVVETFASHDVPVNRIVAGGGLVRNALAMQVYADVLGHDLEIVESESAPARGAAMLGAVAAGTGRGGYADVEAAVRAMNPGTTRVVRAGAEAHATYRRLHRHYGTLANFFGRETRALMHDLHAMRLQVESSAN